MIKRILVIAVVVLLGFEINAFSSVDISQRKGTFKLITPDGSVTVVKMKESIPMILEGTKIELLDGFIQVTTANDSKIDILIGGKTISMDANTMANVNLNTATNVAIVEIVFGNSIVKIPDGSSAALDTGDRIRFSSDAADNGVDVLVGEVPLSTPDGEVNNVKVPLAGEGEALDKADVPSTIATDADVQPEDSIRDSKPDEHFINK